MRKARWARSVALAVGLAPLFGLLCGGLDFPFVTPAQAAPRGRAAKKEYPADLETAEQLYAKLDYEAANKVAARVLEKRSLSHDELVRAYRVLATTHAVLDHGDAAREAFVLLLTYAPDEAVDTNLGPKVTGPFYEARGFWRSQPSRPGIELLTSAAPGAGGSLKIAWRDPTHVVRRVNAGYRWGSDGPFTEVNVDLPAASATVPVSPPPSFAASGTRLDSYVQARDDHEDVVFESGSPLAPKSTTVAVPPPVSPRPALAHEEGEHKSGFFASTPFWIGVGVVVAGGAVLTYFLARPKDQSAPSEAMIVPNLNCGTGTRCQ